MTIAISCCLADGIVLGADSAVTVTLNETLEGGTQKSTIAKVYNDARKLFPVYDVGADMAKVGVVTYGMGMLANRTIESYVREFEIEKAEANLSAKSVSDVAGLLHEFFADRYEETLDDVYKSLPIERRPLLGMFVGGFSPKQALPELWQVHASLPRDDVGAVRCMREPGDFGSNWGGQFEGVQRFHKGYSPQVMRATIEVLANHLRPNQKLTEEEQREIVAKVVTAAAKYEYFVPFVAMPLQQGIDYVRFLLRMAISQHQFVAGAPTCGGEVRICVITQFGDFQWVTPDPFAPKHRRKRDA